MCKNQPTEQLFVRDVFCECEFRVCDADSMQKVAHEAPSDFSVIPVFDYSNTYIGGLLPDSFIDFQIEYFNNLDNDGLGNEFVIGSKEDSDIHFVPIDRVSRYADTSIQPVGIGETVEQTEKILSEQGISAAPVFDSENHIVGTVSLLDIAKAKFDREAAKKKCCKTAFHSPSKTANMLGSECQRESPDDDF